MEKLPDYKEIPELLPHRYPFLLVDGIIDFQSNVFIKGIKNVTFNEPFFQGHFPGEPMMPGVLILEALAQTGIIFAKLTDPVYFKDSLFVFAGIDEVRFKKPVRPGDQLVLELTLLKRKANIWKMQGKARVKDELVAEAVLMAAAQKRSE